MLDTAYPRWKDEGWNDEARPPVCAEYRPLKVRVVRLGW